MALNHLGRLAHQAGDNQRAVDLFAHSISASLSIDERWSVVRPLVYLAEIATHYGFPRDAAVLLGVIDGCLRRSRASMLHGYRSRFEAINVAISNSLDPRTFQAALQAGSLLSASEIESVVDTLKLRIVGPAVLTQRELEVLQRVATGATDREIAEALFVSPRTVHTHLSHILTKLDVSSRKGAVKRARELGFLSGASGHPANQ